MRKTSLTTSISDHDQDVIAAAKRALRASCKAESSVPMPYGAQDLHGRENYVCGLPGGHSGPHRWPWHDGSLAEWPQAPAEDD